MTATQVRKAIQKRPFRPLLIQTTGGENYRVTHPEAIWQAQAPEETTVILQDRDQGVIFTDTADIAAIVFSSTRKPSS
jgi:hypothetical protein